MSTLPQSQGQPEGHCHCNAWPLSKKSKDGEVGKECWFSRGCPDRSIPQEPQEEAGLQAAHCYSNQVSASWPTPGWGRGMHTSRSEIMPPTKFLTSRPLTGGGGHRGVPGTWLTARFAHKRAARLQPWFPTPSSIFPGKCTLPLHPP